MTRRIDPLAGLDVDLFANQSDLRSPAVELHDCILRFDEVDRFVRQLGERAEFEEQRADLRRIRERAARFAAAQIHVHVRHPGRRVEDRKEARAEVVGELQQAFVAGHLV